MNTIILNDKDLFKEYGLILNSYSEKLPIPKINKIEIPGLDGYLDITEALTGRPVYGEREIIAKFTALGRNIAEAKLSNFLNEFHGKKVKLVLPDRYGYLEGRCVMDGKERNPVCGVITASFVCQPFFYDNTEAGDPDWLWDPFSFEQGIIYPTSYAISGETTINVPSAPKSSTPTIKSTADMTLTFKGETYHIKTGENRMTGMALENGDNIMTVTGNGTLIFIYRGKRL